MQATPDPCTYILTYPQCTGDKLHIVFGGTRIMQAMYIHTYTHTYTHVYTGDKLHIVFGGTRVMQATPDPDTYPKGVPRPTENGCLGYVIRNGFNTAQGRLVRTIMFSQEQATAGTRDAVCYCVCVCVYVCIYIYTYIYIHTYVCVYIYVYIYIYICIFTICKGLNIM
jgi:cation-transporting ATPase 13A1